MMAQTATVIEESGALSNETFNSEHLLMQILSQSNLLIAENVMCCFQTLSQS